MPHHVKRHTSSSSLDEVNFQAVLAYLAQIRIGRRAAHGWLGSRARIKIILELWNVMRERLWKIWSQRSIGHTCQHNGKLYSGQKFELSGPWADLSWAKYEAHNQFSDIRDVLLRKKLLFFWILSKLHSPRPPSPQFGQLVQFFWTPKTFIISNIQMTYYPKFFLKKAEYLLWGSFTQPKEQFKVQIIGILEEKDPFYWPKMHVWKGDKKFGQGPPPHLNKIQKNSNFFSRNHALHRPDHYQYPWNASFLREH